MHVCMIGNARRRYRPQTATRTPNKIEISSNDYVVGLALLTEAPGTANSTLAMTQKPYELVGWKDEHPTGLPATDRVNLAKARKYTIRRNAAISKHVLLQENERLVRHWADQGGCPPRQEKGGRGRICNSWGRELLHMQY
jgi:hypothetical protein